MRDHGRVGVPRMTDRVYLSNDGGSGYDTCGPTPPAAVIDQYFVKRQLHQMPPLILIVYSRLDRGIQSATEMLHLKGGRSPEGAAYSYNCTAPCLSICVLLTHLFVFISLYFCYHLLTHRCA